MTPERWQQVKAICYLLLDCDPAARAARLTELCADDDALKSDVAAMFADAFEHGEVSQASVDGGVLGAPLLKRIGLASLGAFGPSPLPATIGNYRIVRLIGEGGMGFVYEAEQIQPRRTVALKVIKPGLASAEISRRFEQESQALGRLQHPGIAQIYEAGTADTGYLLQPYFAMEYVRGESLSDYARTHDLTVRQRLQLVAKICEAVNHAHQRGLIHRDLKPANILVDASGHPKILDFGIARLTDSDVQTTRQTDVGQLLGTLAYMSPEQVLADPLELDTRSDVYALGIVLYELLTGRLPYTVSPRLHEAIHAIREESPASLSAIHRAYRGDIETIVGKALEKEKARRYGSAAALAEDIRRYLDDQPIAARPASATYQLHKFARRHKALIGGVGAAFVALAVGTVVSIWQAQRAREAQRSAVAAEQRVVVERDEATRQRNFAVDAQNQAREERNQAVGAREQAQQERNEALAAKQRADTESAISQAVSRFLRDDLLAQASARAQSQPDRRPDPDLKVRTALDRAATHIDREFRSQPLVEAAIRQTIGSAYQDLGLYPEAQQHFERAVALRNAALGGENPATLESLGTLAALYQFQGRYADAEALLLKVVAADRRMLGPEDPATLNASANLANTYRLNGKYANAEAVAIPVLEIQRRVLGAEHPDTLASMGGLASTEELLRKYDEAESLYLRVQNAMQHVLGPDHPDTLSAMNDVALFYKRRERFKDAERLYLEGLVAARRVLGEDHPDTLGTMNNLGALYVAQNRFAEAEPLLADTLTRRKRALGAEHPNTLNTMANLGQVYLRQGKLKEAEPFFEEIVAIRRRRLGPEHPDTLFMMGNLAVLYSREGKGEAAESMWVQLLEIERRTIGEDHPDTLRALDNLGTEYIRRGDVPRAQAIFMKSVDGRRRVLGPEHVETLRSITKLADSYRLSGRLDEAERMLQRNLESERRVLGRDHDDTVTAMEKLAELYRQQGQYDRARDLLVDALAARQRTFGAEHPYTVENRSMLALVHLQRQEYADVERLLKGRDPGGGSSTAFWQRDHGKTILGAALMADSNFAEAETLLVDGYQGLTAQVAMIPAESRIAIERAGRWIVQLYERWDKPERAAEWKDRLARRGQTPPRDQ